MDMEKIKKRRLNGGLIEKTYRNILVVTALLFMLYAWPQLHLESWILAGELLAFWFSVATWKYYFNFAIHQFKNHPILIPVELLILLLLVKNFFIRGQFLLLFKPRVWVFMVGSILWLNFLYNANEHLSTKIYTFLFNKFYYYSLFVYLLQPLKNPELVMKMFILGLVYLMSIVFTRGTSHIYMPMLQLSEEELKDLGLNEVMDKVNPIRKIFRPVPRVYYTSYIVTNAFAYKKGICIAKDLLLGDRLQLQSLFAHELGHYYHYDIDSSNWCLICMNTFFLPTNIMLIILSIIMKIPYLNFFAFIPTFLFAIYIKIAGLLLNIIALILYFIDGRYMEKQADLFSVDIGYGYGNCLFLKSLIGCIPFFYSLIDVHLPMKTRCKYIKKRIIYNWGKLHGMS